MTTGSSDRHTGGPTWVVGSRHRGERLQTLYVWAPAQQVERVERQLGIALRLGLMDIADLQRVMQAWSARFGASDRQQARWEDFADGARVEIAIVMEPSPRQPTPLLLHGADSIAALAAAVPAGRQVPVFFARAMPAAVRPGAGVAPPAEQGDRAAPATHGDIDGGELAGADGRAVPRP